MKFYQYLNETLQDEIQPIWDKIRNSPLTNEIVEKLEASKERGIKFVNIIFKTKNINKYVKVDKNIALYLTGSDSLKLKIYETFKSMDEQTLYSPGAYFSFVKPLDLTKKLKKIYEMICSIKTISEELDENENRDINDRTISPKMYTLLSEEERLKKLRKNPNIINLFYDPSRIEIENVINQSPWSLTDRIFDECPDNCDDLKLQWSRIGKARKQIGL